MQPSPIITANALFLRLAIWIFQTMNHGKIPRVKSMTAVTAFDMYKIPNHTGASRHLLLKTVWS